METVISIKITWNLCGGSRKTRKIQLQMMMLTRRITINMVKRKKSESGDVIKFSDKEITGNLVIACCQV